jgi:hypothetical protein
MLFPSNNDIYSLDYYRQKVAAANLKTALRGSAMMIFFSKHVPALCVIGEKNYHVHTLASICQTFLFSHAS